jgi:hypothetical protein
MQHDPESEFDAADEPESRRVPHDAASDREASTCHGPTVTPEPAAAAGRPPESSAPAPGPIAPPTDEELAGERSVAPATAPRTIATPAQRLLVAVGDWPENATALGKSERTYRLRAAGYKWFVLDYGQVQAPASPPPSRPPGGVMLTLRAAAADVVEIQSLVAYPHRCGYGSLALGRLCRLADELGVKIWGDATPYGSGTDDIPLPRLLAWYQHFGFFAIRRVDRRWVSDYHRWDRWEFENVLLRNPIPAGRADAA